MNAPPVGWTGLAAPALLPWETTARSGGLEAGAGGTVCAAAGGEEDDLRCASGLGGVALEERTGDGHLRDQEVVEDVEGATGIGRRVAHERDVVDGERGDAVGLHGAAADAAAARQGEPTQRE